jgi:hypothetical protein
VRLRGSRVEVVRGDVRQLHCQPEFNRALFQVASQFNLLEMTGPDVTPEHGVTRYAFDRTQGPACAIAAGAATIYRNYFATVGDGSGPAAVANAQRGASRTVLLTLVGGGAFGNREDWILGAMRRAFRLTEHVDLDVRIVSHGEPSPA